MNFITLYNLFLKYNYCIFFIEIQNSNVQQFWTDITRLEEDDVSDNNDKFMSDNVILI